MTVVQPVNLLAAIALVEMMTALALSVGASDVVAVSNRWDLLSGALSAKYVIVPGAALGLLLLSHASPIVVAGFLVAAVCPGAPYGPPFTSAGEGNVTLAAALMVILAASSAIVAPTLRGLLLPVAVRNYVVKISAMTIIVTLRSKCGRESRHRNRKLSWDSRNHVRHCVWSLSDRQHRDSSVNLVSFHSRYPALLQGAP